jgi:hypothetical protein
MVIAADKYIIGFTTGVGCKIFLRIMKNELMDKANEL